MNFVSGYAFNLCKTDTFAVPYDQNIKKEEIDMAQKRIRIVDVADALGLSTATVSKVIHGKTEKISGFISRKGRPFSAYLVLKDDGKVGFEFDNATGRTAKGASKVSKPKTKKSK